MARSTTVPVLHPESFFIGGSWVAPSSDAKIDVIDAGHRGALLPRRRGAGAGHGPRRRGRPHRVRRGPVAAPHPRPAGRVPARRSPPALNGARRRPRRRSGPASPASLAQHRQVGRGWGPRARSRATPRWPTRSRSRSRPRRRPAGFGLLVREPVGVVGAIVPWNAPIAAHREQGRSRAASPGARSC